MKKLLFIFLSAFFLTACTRPPAEPEVEYYQYYHPVEDSDNLEWSPESPIVQQCNLDAKVEIPAEIGFGVNNLPLIHLTPEACEIVLEDFNYLAEIILANMPAQVLAPLRVQMQMVNFLNSFRHRIVNFHPVQSLHSFLVGYEFAFGSTEPMPTDDRELAAHYLSSLLYWLGLDIGSLGHLGPRDFATYWEQLEHAAASFHQSEVIDGRMVYNGEFGLDIRLAQHRFDTFASESTLWFFGVELSDLDLYRDLSDFGFREVDNITTEIIEDGRIAYFRIRSFMNNPGFDSEILFPFFEEVQEFDHLIIDLRNNGGGWGHYFPDYVVAALIDETVVAYRNEFFMSGDLSRQIAEYSLADWLGSADEILLAADFIDQNDFPLFNSPHLDFLTYVIRWQQVIEPLEGNIPFNGKIWLLVNQGSASASELAATISMTSGFATVVGQNTLGVTATMNTYVSLPNTGVLFRIDTGYTIDTEGRQLERFGVTPDIIVPIGTNILDYVLAIIENY